MEDSDSELEVLSTMMSQSKNKDWIVKCKMKIHEDDDSLFETVKQKRRKMNKKKRVVLKNGLTNVSYKNISMKRRRYVSDLYTTLLDSSWTYIVLMFTTSFYGSWIVFGGIYYSIAYFHDDFTEEHLGPNSSWIPCISAVDGFASSFLFSLETQHTIGYGTRQTTTECPDAMILMSVQVNHNL